MLARVQPTGIEIKFNGSNKLFPEVARDKHFRTALTKLLNGAGYTEGPFNVTVSSLAKGASHKQGLRVGSPREPRRLVELTWQPRGNDCCYAVAITSPYEISVTDFHLKLDTSARHIDDEATRTLPPPNKEKALMTETSATHFSTDSARVEEFLLHMCKDSASGILRLESCRTVLSTQFGCADPSVVIAELTEAQYLVPVPGSEEFIRIAKEYVELLADPMPAPSEIVSISSPVAAIRPIEVEVSHEKDRGEADPSTSSYTTFAVTRVKEVVKLAEKAQAHHGKLISLATEMKALEEQILSKQQLLLSLRMEEADIRLFLEDPKTIEAEKKFIDIERLLSGK